MIIETNQGLERAIEIAKSSPRIDSMILGAVDMSAELRCQKAWEPLLYTRSRLVHAAASAGIDLLDVPYLNLDDPAGLKAEARGLPAARVHRQGVDPSEPDPHHQRCVHAGREDDREGAQGVRGLRGRTTPDWWWWTAS